MIMVVLITMLVVCFASASFIANCGHNDKENKTK